MFWANPTGTFLEMDRGGAVGAGVCGCVLSEGGAGVEVPELRTDETDQAGTPWNVVVHNDPVNLMSYVTRVFQRVLGFSREKAEQHMMEVHVKGRSVVWSGERERAELYVQQLQAHLLLATMERVG